MGYCTSTYSTCNFHPNFYVISISPPYSFSHWGLFSLCPCYEFYPDLAFLALGCWKDPPFALFPSPLFLLLHFEPIFQYTVSYSQISRATWSQCLSIWNQGGTQLISLSFWSMYKQIMSYHAPKYSILAALVVWPPGVPCFPHMVTSLCNLPESVHFGKQLTFSVAYFIISPHPLIISEQGFPEYGT